MDYKIIVYTDGSAGPTMPGNLGSGYHGYIYDADEEVKRSGDVPKDGYPSIYGYVGKDNEVEFKEYEKEKIRVVPIGYIDGMFSPGNNYKGYANDAEVDAIVYFFSNLVKNFNSDIEIFKNTSEITLLADSLVALLVMKRVLQHYNTWYDKCIGKDGFKQNKLEECIKENYKNLTDNVFRYVSSVANILINTFGKELPKLNLVKVKGHNGNIGNEVADSWAVCARKYHTMVDTSVLITDRYWKPTIDKHPLLRYKELFFMLNSKDVGYLTIMNYSSAFTVGQRTADVIYGVVSIAEDPVIDLIRELNNIYNARYTNDPILLYAMDLNEIYKPENVVNIRNFKDKIFTMDNKGNIRLNDEINVIYPIKPSGLAKQVYDTTMSFSVILEDFKLYLKDNKKPDHTLDWIDITDKVFKVKGKKLECILPNGNKDITLKDVNVLKHKFDLKLYHNIDIIDRNHLKALDKYKDTKVYVVFKPNGNRCIKYYTVITVDSKNIYGIWQNMFSSRIYL